MQAPPSIATPAQYLASLPPDRAAALRHLHDAIQSAAPGLTPSIGYGMLAFGRFSEPDPKGRPRELYVVALASQKQYISLYLCSHPDGTYPAEASAARLGKVSVGRSCIRFRKLEDLNLPVALELVRAAAELRLRG